jgi:hypothetical protein
MARGKRYQPEQMVTLLRQNAAFRSFTKPTKQRFAQALLRLVNNVAVHSPAGLYLGPRLSYDVDLERLCKVVERSVLGLYLEEFKTRWPEGHGCKVLISLMHHGQRYAK